MKMRDCSIHEAKTKALIRCAITAHQICVFVFAYKKARNLNQLTNHNREKCQPDSYPSFNNHSKYIQQLTHKKIKLICFLLQVEVNIFVAVVVVVQGWWNSNWVNGKKNFKKTIKTTEKAKAKDKQIPVPLADR